MNSEESRYLTFANWPANSIVDPKRVAKAGFYYLGQGLEVKCFSCGRSISEWNYGDKAMNKHAALNPACPFVINPSGCGNIPIETSLSRESHHPRTSTELDSVMIASRNAGRESVAQQFRYSRTDYQQNESARLESFNNWPKPYIVTPESLSRAGFFYTHQLDKVQCAFCNGVVSHWEAGDDPVEEHNRHFPNCSFIQMLRSSNDDDDDEFSNEEFDYDEDRNDDEEETDCELNKSPEGVEMRFPSSNGQNPESTMRELGVQSHKVPKHPKYSIYEARLQTFVNWPADVAQTPENISEAGFFYAGSGDQVRCFHCDGGLRMWDPSDEPWIEHARWFPHCGFILLVKGQEFVDEALLLRPPLDESQIEEQLGRVSKPKIGDHIVPFQSQRNRVPVTESQLQELISSPTATAALQLGLEFSRVKTALRQRAASGAPPFDSAQALINAALDVQFEEATEEEVRETWLTPPNTPVPFTGSSTRRINSSRYVTASTEEDTEADDELETINASPPPPKIVQRVHAGDNKDRKTETENVASVPACNPSPKNLSHSADDDRRSIQCLEEEVRRLKEARLCKICMDKETCVVFLPCGHLVTCVQCAHSLADCPVCRKQIKATVRTFLS